MSEGNEGGDDGPPTPAPGQRSVGDIFKAFGDGIGDSRDKVAGEEGDEEGEITEETEEERQDREERERVEALTSSRVTHALNTPERETEIMKEVFRSTKPKDEDDE